MSVEDFFSLAEMKGGLSTLSRVQEMISAMEKQKDCALDTHGDTARQWSVFVETLVATENRDCLKQFVQLNGVCFLNKWLHEGQKYGTDVSDSMLEGFVSASLAVLDKLPIDKDKLNASGIGITVEQLLSHRNFDIKGKANKLTDKWNALKIHNASCDYLVDHSTFLNDQSKTSTGAPPSEDSVQALCPIFTGSPANGENGDKHCEVETMSAETHFSNVSDSSQVDATKDAKNSVSDELMPPTLSNSAGMDAKIQVLNSVGSSLIPESCIGKSGMTESSDCPAVGLTSAGISSPPVGGDDDQRDISVFREVSEDIEEMEVDLSRNEGSPCKYSVKESCIASTSGLTGSLPSSSDEDMQGSDGVVNVIPSDSSVAEETKASSQTDQKTRMGLESEEIDALEVACQVALEVEREVVDYREPFCSSPEANSRDTMGTHCSKGKPHQSLTVELDGNASLLPKEFSFDASSPKAVKSCTPENTVSNLQEVKPSKSPKLASIAYGSAGDFDKNICDFDLNDDISTEEFNCSMDHMPSLTVNLSAPKAVMATSKGTPSLPVTPLQFEGELGWKGSAATSAFRPASPRRTPECEKACSSSKKLKCLEFDLNVVDSELVMAVDPPILRKQLPVSSGLPSGDSSVEVSSRRAEKLKLDLNRLGDEETPVNPSSYWKLQHQNGDQILSSASSSSSRQPSMRDFDLNDNLSFLDAGGSSKVSTTNYGVSRPNDTSITIMGSTTNYGVSRPNDTSITIMGSRMSVEPKDFLAQAPHQSFFGSGLNMEAMITARQALPYAHMSASHMYNGQPSGPTFLFPPSLYGPGSIPYMVDSRGTTVIPQALGSTMSNLHSVRPPFLTSGAHSHMYGAGPSKSGFDLNSCMTSVESCSREGGSFKQLFMRDHDELVEEQTRISLQPSSSTMSLKRKEPECGWEPYTVGYKQLASWQ